MILNICTLNVNHSALLGGVLDYIIREKPDIVFLQEVPLTTEELCSTVGRWGYLASVSLTVDGNPGIGVLYKDTIPIVEIQPLSLGTMQLVRLQGGPDFINVYAPSGNLGRGLRRDFFGDTLLRNLKLRERLPIIIGDFNCVIDTKDTLDNYNLKKCEQLSDLIYVFSYTDAYRKLYPLDISFTYSRPHQAPSRLDRVYLPPMWVDKLVDISSFVCLSDHKLVGVSLEYSGVTTVSPVRSPPVYWKLNTSILDDVNFLPNFKELWARLGERREEFGGVAQWWEDLVKPETVKFLKKFSVLRQQFRRGTRTYLFFLLDFAVHEQDWEQVALLRSRIRSLLQEDLQGFLIRSRAKEHAEEEMGSMFHAARELKQGKKCSLNELIIDNVIVNDPAIIEGNLLKYYGSLFNGHHRSTPGSPEARNTGVDFVMDQDNLSIFLEGLDSLTVGSRVSLTEDLTMDELFLALQTCASNRSPGLDGLPYEFYSKVKYIIGGSLVEVFQEQLDRELLVKSNREGVTRLLSKVDGVPKVTDLRPITLLSSDYKILSKILVRRLNAVLPDVLTSGQLCSNPPQNILFGVSDTLSVLDYIAKEDIPAFLVSFDIMKAYDKTCVDFICIVMRKMNFPNLFISWVRTLHRDINTRFVLSELTDSLEVKISLRQGDPMSMPLFLLNIEPFLAYVKKILRGIRVGSVVHRKKGYVDDVSAASSDTCDLLRVNEAFHLFESVSGTVLNRAQKSKIMGLGPWEGRQDWPLPWLKTEPSLRIFGVNFHPKFVDTLNHSWQECFQGFNKCIQSWSSRNLPTLLQRVRVLNVFALSKLWYLAQVLPLPKKWLGEMEKKVRAFLWRGRLEHLPFDELFAPVKQGGLGLPNIAAKADSLFLKQTCRVLGANCDSRGHLAYWAGLTFRSIIPDMARGPNSEHVPPLWRHSSRLVLEAVSGDLIDVQDLRQVRAKLLYKEFMSDPPPPKVISKYPGLDWPLIWSRLDDPVLSPRGRDLCFSVLNNIYPTKERLSRLNQHPTGNCPLCRGSTDDCIHLFTDCSRSRAVWVYLKNVILSIVPMNANFADFSNFNLLYFCFPNCARDQTILFLVSMYVVYVHNSVYKNENLSIQKLKGFLKNQVSFYRHGKFPILWEIPALL